MEKRDNRPLVSVIMATYNEPRVFIEQAINSILSQSYSHFEFIIADDSTKQETIEAIDRAASDERVRVIRKDRKMGFVNALDIALKEAKGVLLARMDADDISLPDRLEKQVAFAQDHPGIDLFGGCIFIINGQGDVVSERHYPTTPSGIMHMFVYRNPFAHPTIMFRRKIVDDGFLYDTNFKKAEDLEFYLRLYKHGYRFGNMADKLLKYRVLGDQQEKRDDDNWAYNHMARKKNFMLKHPLFSLCSWGISLAYEYAPKKIISYFYKKENSK